MVRTSWPSINARCLAHSFTIYLRSLIPSAACWGIQNSTAGLLPAALTFPVIIQSSALGPSSTCCGTERRCVLSLTASQICSILLQYSAKANLKMSTTLRCTLVVCVALALFAAGCNVEASKARPPRNNEIHTMADAIKYLQDLDVYYGDRARVRFGKRGALMQTIRNRILANGLYNNNNELMNDNNGEEMIPAIGQEEVF